MTFIEYAHQFLGHIVRLRGLGETIPYQYILHLENDELVFDGQVLKVDNIKLNNGKDNEYYPLHLFEVNDPDSSLWEGMVDMWKESIGWPKANGDYHYLTSDDTETVTCVDGSVVSIEGEIIKWQDVDSLSCFRPL